MKNIIVITGASNGLGYEFLNQFNQKNEFDEIWAIDYDGEGLEKLKKEYKNVKGLKIDLTDKDEIQKYKKELEKEEVNVKVLVNCAGFGKFDHSENIDLDTKLNMVDLNVKAYISMIDYTLPYMKSGSKILNVASCAGFQPVPYVNCYASTKAFILSYSRSLNMELAYKDIHVLAVCPYWTKTKFFERAVIKGKKEVVINYEVMYEAKDVVTKAIHDLYTNKDMSVYGGLNNKNRILGKIFPQKFIMKYWMRQQKFDGTPNIR